MITENQLNEAIAEMNGERHPDANTCIKLASYYTIKNELFPKGEGKPQISQAYSMDSPPVVDSGTIDYDSTTDFGKAVYGRNTSEIMSILDDVMSALYVINQPLYKRILRELGA